MSGLAHFLESEGLSTVVVALVREHAVKMAPPRALWVPFQLGRPFASPHDSDQQRRVLNAALALLEKPGPGPILENFGEEESLAVGDARWEPPGNLESESTVAELWSLLPAWQKARTRLKRSSAGISGLSPEAAVEYVSRYRSSDPMPNPKGMAPVSRVRFAIDDIKAVYFEAAIAEGGHPSSFQLNEWFWNQTLAGKMILDFQDYARIAEDKNLRALADFLVPPERTLEYLGTA